MSRRARLIALYMILGLCALGIAIPTIEGKQPSEALIAVLGTVAGYIFLGGSGGNGSSEGGAIEGRRRKDAKDGDDD